jgi:hypothetical protein
MSEILQQGPISINPPPSEDTCDCCGRPVRELKPFGGAGDPLRGDFSGDLLVKKKRPAGPRDEAAERIYSEYFREGQTDTGRAIAEKLLILRSGQKQAARIIGTVHAAGCVGSSWECRSCAILDNAEYFDVLLRTAKR